MSAQQVGVTGRPPGERQTRKPGRRPLTRGAIVVGLLGVLFLLLGLSGGSYQGKLSEVEKNDNAAFLPQSAESTKVDTQAQLFQSVQTMPGFVVYQRPAGLTGPDRAAIAADAERFRAIPGVAADQVRGPQYAADGATAAVSVPLVAKVANTSVSGETMKKVENEVLRTARAGLPPGLTVHSAGPAGLLVALIGAFGGIDGTLLIAALVVVVVVLLIVYRSPFLWFFPLFSAVLALGTASLIVYQLAKHGVLKLNGQSTGILSVLVLGAGTDYALFLTSRYREELHNFDSRVEAMTKAWRRSASAIVASGSTVILALLTLTAGELNSVRSLGPVCAIGLGSTVAVMLTFLPASLAAMPRRIFWPRVPTTDHRDEMETHHLWGRFARYLGRHDRVAWVSAVLALGICAAGITTLKTGGLPISQGFTSHPDAVIGQRVFDAHFPRGSGAPAQITSRASAIPQVVAAVSKVPGVSSAPGSVCIEPDYARLAQSGAASGGAPGGGCPPADLSVSPKDGRLLVDAVLEYGYDSPLAFRTVQDIRRAVHAIPGAEALVGGQAAINYDTNQAARHDRNLIIPIVLIVILFILIVLLRAVVAPLLLMGSVVLSLTATLGISAFFFNHVFHYANSDPGFPLFVFIFLVALGVDYNIFLMTRVREETLSVGTRAGILRGLTVTGGVITSAGIVLAATFAVLRVIPLVFLAELGFTVALGVLLDTIVVRSVVVPALSHDIGKAIWWPSRLSRRRD